MLSAFSILYEIAIFGTCVEILFNFSEIYSGHFASVKEAKVGRLCLIQREPIPSLDSTWGLVPGITNKQTTKRTKSYFLKTDFPVYAHADRTAVVSWSQTIKLFEWTVSCCLILFIFFFIV
uniref:Uncharacterized protein n=1 Tax=Mus musculus TaxID=10090 RepID=Q9CX36_MOUSE|nr:unnamed protein product [Mus musculus]